MFYNHLLYRIVVLNGLGAAVLVWAWTNGYLDYLAYDTSGISIFICMVALFGLVSIFIRALKVSSALNDTKAGRMVSINPAKFLAKGSHVEFIVAACVGLGFFGTVVGIIMLLFAGGGITSDGSVASITAIIERIMSGGGVAFITTAVGLSTSMWLELNALMLNTATVCMLEDRNA